MKQFFRKWVLNNLAYKIVALLIAFVIWVMFTYSDDPIKTYTVDVNVGVLHLEEYLEQGRFVQIDGKDDLSNLREQVTIRARSTVIEGLRNRVTSNYMNVYVDLYELENSDANRLLLHYEISDPLLQVEFASYKNKTYLPVEVEENISLEIPIEYVITGIPEEGYLYVKDDPEINVSPSTMVITGPQTQIEGIHHAQVTISVSGASANVNKNGQIILKDENDRTLTYSRDAFQVSTTEAYVFVPIYASKTVSLQPYLSGSPVTGYEYMGDVALSVSSVKIYGAESVINKVNSISLPDIDLAQVKGEHTETFDIQKVLDDLYGVGSVNLMDGEVDTVEVAFTVGEQISQIVTVPVSSFVVYGLGSDLMVSYDVESVDVSIFGLPEMLDAFDPATMTVSLRLTSAQKTPGSYTVALEVGGLGGLQYRAVSVKVNVAEVEKTDDKH